MNRARHCRPGGRDHREGHPGFPRIPGRRRSVAQDDEGGWLYTGDNGYLDPEGYLFILGRKKALIKRGGSFISPREVEMAADQIPGVRYNVAIGRPGTSRVTSELREGCARLTDVGSWSVLRNGVAGGR